MTSTPLGKLHSRVVQNQELSPKSKRKQLSQMHQSHTSPSFSSKKKGGLSLGGMTFPISSTVAAAAKSSGISAIDFFQNTITEEVSDSLPGEEQREGEEQEKEERHPEGEELPVTSPSSIPMAISGEDGSEIVGGLVGSQSTSVLANELRKLVKLSSSTAELPSSSSTALRGYSKTPSTSKRQQQHQTKERPKSAGPAGYLPNSTTQIKSTQLTYGGPTLPGGGGGGTGTTSEDLVPRYVKKGGFKMRVSKTMPQERLVENLSKNYFQDQSFPQMTQSQVALSKGAGTEIFFPSSGDLQHLNSSDGTTAFNLSSISQPGAEKEKKR